MKHYFLIFSLLISNSLLAQVGGESVYAFLNLPSAARQVALGGAALTLNDDVNMALWNPAVLDSAMVGNFGVNYNSHLAGNALGSFCFATEVGKNKHIFHGGISYLDYGSLTRADENGMITGVFKAYDLAITVGYAYPIKNSGFTLGANVKIINSLIDNFSSFGLASDFSVFYKGADKLTKFTLLLRNIGTQIKTFDGTKEALPFQISFGGSKKLEHVPLEFFFVLDNLQQWELAVPNPANQVTSIDGVVVDEEISFADNALRHAVLGAELFSERKFSFRAGYNFRRAKEVVMVDGTSYAGFSYGFGLKLNGLQFNYAHTKFHPASNPNTFSLIVKF